MTREEFAEGYAQRSGVTVEQLRQHGREAKPCDCGEDDCPGWQMAHVNESELDDSDLDYGEIREQ